MLRAEEEKRLAEAKKAEDERRYREEQEKKQREQEEKKRRLEEAEKKRQALAQAQKAAAGGKANFKVGKKDDKVSYRCRDACSLSVMCWPSIAARFFGYNTKSEKNPSKWLVT